MNKSQLISGSIMLLLFIASCTTRTSTEKGSIPTDSISIETGRMIFSQNCTACHNFSQDGIGPQLGGLTASVSPEWIKAFIKDPKAIIDGGDKRAQKLFEDFKAVMPPFAGYSDDELSGIVAYINSRKAPDPRKAKLDPNALKNPIPEPIPMSDLVVSLELLTQIPASSEEQPFTRIAKLEIQPKTNELFVMDLRGKLYHLKGNQPEVYLDMASLKPNFIHKPGLATGLGSFAFHPEFASNGLLYTTHTESPGSGKADFEYPDSINVTLQWVLSEWKTKQPGAFPYSGESRELFRINMVTPIHGMQEITFNPLAKPGDADYGLLYIGIGDGGSAESGYPFICHSNERMWGKILRIDPRGNDGPNGHYGIPKSNPFINDANPAICKEIFASGFRNPHRISWTKTGVIIASNVGHHNVEALNIIEPGRDYGWPIREGTFVIDPSQNMHNIYPLPPDDAKNNISYPVAQYDHDEGNAISGGFEYWGSAIPQLKGKYLFGDIVKGRLFYVEMKDLKLGSQAAIKEWQVSIDGKLKTLTELCGAEKVDERFGRDSKGELYILTKPDGRVYRMVGAKSR